MKRLSVRMDDYQYKQLAEFAHDNNLDISGALRAILSQQFDGDETKHMFLSLKQQIEKNASRSCDESLERMQKIIFDIVDELYTIKTDNALIKSILIVLARISPKANAELAQLIPEFFMTD